jgi:tetratricopeptide (TPR) repeat protein
VIRQDSLNRTFQVSYHRLDEKGARLFRALGISPQPFDAKAFSHVLGWDRADTGRTFRELAQNGLVIAKQSGRYATHHLLHEYARLLSRQHDMASLPTWQRRFADHYLELTKRASELWRQGEEPEALHLWRYALAHIRQGCRFAAERGQRSSVLDYLLYTGYYPGANGTDVTTDEWRTRFESLTKPNEESVFGSLQLGHACLLLGDPDQAIPLLRKLRRTADTLGRYRDWVSTTIKLAQSLVVNRHQDEAWEIVAEQRFTRMVAKLPLGDPLQVDACAVAGRVHTLVGRYKEAEFAYSKALATFDNGDTETQHWQHVKLLFELGRIHQALHNNEEAWEVFAEGKELAEAAHYKQLHGAHALHAIISLARMGHPEEAEEKLAALRVNLGKEQGIKAWTRLAQGEILWAKGGPAEARRAYEAAAQGLAGTMAETGVRVLSARRQAQSGDKRRAHEAWAQARESARKTGHWYEYHLATLKHAEHLQQEGRDRQARRLLEEVVDETADVALSLSEQAETLMSTEE